MDKPYTDEEIALGREWLATHGGITLDPSRVFATLDEARAEVARLEAENERLHTQAAANSHSLTRCALEEVQAERDALKAANARLRERVEAGVGLLRQIHAAHPLWLPKDPVGTDHEDEAAVLWRVYGLIDRHLAAADTNMEGGDAESPNARAASGSSGSGERARPSPPASPSPSSASGWEMWGDQEMIESAVTLLRRADGPLGYLAHARAHADRLEAWQASRAALPTREEIADAVFDGLPSWMYEDTSMERLRDLGYDLADRILALIGGDDAE